MDYDKTAIPESYDRARDLGPALLDLWMRAIASHVGATPIDRILDLGCGTGRFSEALADRFGAEVVGVDPSQRMLGKARAKRRDPRVGYVAGRAEAIPLADASVDMVFMSMCFHHFQDQALAARECRRVLRPRRNVFVRTGTRERIDEYPHVPFFPSSRAAYEAILPSAAGLCRIFEGAGLRLVAAGEITQETAPSWAAYVDKVAAPGYSVLARLTAAELDTGLAAMRRREDAGRHGPIIEVVDLFVFA